MEILAGLRPLNDLNCAAENFLNLANHLGFDRWELTKAEPPVLSDARLAHRSKHPGNDVRSLHMIYIYTYIYIYNYLLEKWKSMTWIISINVSYITSYI